MEILQIQLNQTNSSASPRDTTCYSDPRTELGAFTERPDLNISTTTGAF